MPRIGTNTNSNDPQSLRSRVFVGNIDPSMSRDEIESIFQRYGSVSALSVHKGFAFVQYNDELSARAAVFGENNKKYYSKYLDCNVASEPKPNRKRAYNYNSPESCATQVHPYLAATAQALAAQQSAAPPAPPPPPVQVPVSWPDYGASSAKFSRVGASDYGGTRASNLVSLVAQSSPAKPRPAIPAMPMMPPMTPLEPDNQNEKVSTKDILICGCCKGLFDNYDTLINHKAQGCRLRFICRCKQMGEPKSLTCCRCFLTLRSSWELVLHHINAHGASLFVDEERYSQPVAASTDAAEIVKDAVRSESAKAERPGLANGQIVADLAARKSPEAAQCAASTAARETDIVGDVDRSDENTPHAAGDVEISPLVADGSAGESGESNIEPGSCDAPVLQRSVSPAPSGSDHDVKTSAGDDNNMEEPAADPDVDLQGSNHDDESQPVPSLPDEEAADSDVNQNARTMEEVEKKNEEKMDDVDDDMTSSVSVHPVEKPN